MSNLNFNPELLEIFVANSWDIFWKCRFECVSDVNVKAVTKFMFSPILAQEYKPRNLYDLIINRRVKPSLWYSKYIKVVFFDDML